MRKEFKAELKELTDHGEGILRIATLGGDPDKDGDISLPGYFGRQHANLLPVHDWKHIPLGKGIISESHDAALFQFKLNLDLQQSRDWYSALKFDISSPPSLQQVSYGFSLHKDAVEQGVKDGQAVRYLKPRPTGEPGCKVHEVSLVLVAAGVGTGIVDLKESKPNTPHEIMVLGEKAPFEIQMLLFPREQWDSAEACQKWAAEHEFSADGVETTDTAYRIRQKDPEAFVRLRTIGLATDGDTGPEDCRVQAVGGPMKEASVSEGDDLKASFQHLFDETLGQLDLVVGRFEHFKSMRDSEGRAFSTSHVERVKTLAERLQRLEEIAKHGKADPQVAAALFDRFQSLQAKITR